jgi:hypothetical protein
MTDSDALKARVLAAAAATPSPTRPQGRRRAIAFMIASIAVGLAIFEAAGGLAHSAGRPLELTIAIASGWALFCAGLSWIVLRRGRSTLGRRPAVLLIGALSAPIVLVVWMHLFSGTYTEPFARVGWRCFAGTLVAASPPLASLLVLRRGAEPRHPWALGAGIGAVCGAWAGTLSDLWCPLTNVAHVLVGHALPLGLLIALGTLLGQKMLGVQAS